MTDIKPALTAGMGMITVDLPANARHAIAVVALSNQKLGFTENDVAVLRQVAKRGYFLGFLGSGEGLTTRDGEIPNHERLLALADRIEALLLPPEDAR